MPMQRLFVLKALGLNFMLIAFLTQVSQKATPKPPEVACSNTPDEAEIYSAAIHDTLLKDDQSEHQIVLLDETFAGYPPGMSASTSFGGKAKKELLEASGAETKSDFDARTRLHCSVTTNIEPRSRIVFVNPKEEEMLFPGGAGNWSKFKKHYPRASGFTVMSAIGFNGAHDQALLYVGTSCGDLCGSGYFVLLTKKDGQWQVEKVANIWVS
jgi:hypothetical protein